MANLQNELSGLNDEADLLAKAAKLAVDAVVRSQLLNRLDAVKDRAKQIKEEMREQTQLAREQEKQADANQKALDAQRKAADGIRGAFARVALAIAGAGVTVKSVVPHFAGLFAPGAARIFSREMENLGAAIGRILLPVLNTMTAVVERLNIFLTNLSPATRRMIAALALTAAAAATAAAAIKALSLLSFSNPILAIATVAAGILAVSAAAGYATKSVGRLVLAMYAAGVAVSFFAGPLGGALVAAAVAVGFLASKWETLSRVFKPVTDAVGAVIDAFDEVFAAVGDAFQAIYEATLKPFVDFLVNEFISAIKWAADRVIDLAAAIATLAKRFREGRLEAAGFWKEANLRAAEMRNKKDQKTFASGEFGYNSSLEEASKKLQIAGLNNVQGPKEEDLPSDVSAIRGYVQKISEFFLGPLGNALLNRAANGPGGLPGALAGGIGGQAAWGFINDNINVLRGAFGK
jgi:hypothetical protein